MIISARGIGGGIEVYENKIVIKRKGLMSFMLQGVKGDKEIFISQISSIQFKKANMVTNGYIQFTFSGGQEAKGGVFQAVKDENTIVFNSTQQKDFENIKSEIEKLISQKNINSNQSVSIADEIKKFAELKDKGIISDEDFQKKKDELLK